MMLLRIRVAVVLLAGCFLAAEPVQVFFGPRAADDGAGLLANLMRFLDTAEESIYGSVHEVDMIVVAERLADKAWQGVDVRLVIEGQWWDLAKNKAARQVLERSPIRVIVEGRKSGLLHNKFFVADGKRVWTGSTNLTESCLFFNPNNGVWVEEPRVAANFLAKFAEQEQGRFGKKASVRDRLPHPVVEVGGLRIRTLFAPEEDPAATLVEVIDRAEQSVDVMCFVFSSRPITEALLRAHRRGVRVRVLLDNLFASTASTARWKYVPFRELRQAGVACKYDDENSKLHHKVLIADGRTVVLGSYNFSDAGGQENDENVLIVDGEAVASRYQAEFDRLWRYYPDRRVPVPATEGDTDD